MVNAIVQAIVEPKLERLDLILWNHLREHDKKILNELPP
jgi:hypothetical protein